MTAAEQLMERGELRGIREVLLNLLRERFGTLPETVVTRVATADTTQLRTWTRRVLKASGLDDVFSAA